MHMHVLSPSEVYNQTQVHYVAQLGSWEASNVNRHPREERLPDEADECYFLRVPAVVPDQPHPDHE